MKSLLVSLSLILLAGCGAPDSSSTMASAKDERDPAGISVEPGTFRMYVMPGGPLDDRCTFFTELTLANGFQAPVARLVNGVTGDCDVRVDPTRRAFALNVTVDGCGTKHLVSQGLEILDHRHRTCKDVVRAKIILNEDNQGFLSTLYSDDRPVSVTVTRTEQGTFTVLAAIGGETSSYGLRLKDGEVIELDLATHGFAAEFAEGLRVEVTGRMVQVEGVEIPLRTVLVVTTLRPMN